MSRERRLGRGLEALLGRVSEPVRSPSATPPIHTGQESASIEPPQPPPAPPPADDRMSRDGSGQLWLDISVIDRNPYQPREDFSEDGLQALVESIQSHGVLQPLVVRRNGDRFQLIMGERRLRAASKAGWNRVPIQIRDADDRQMAELAIVENVQRKDLNALEKAASFAWYLEKFGCSQEELGQRINIDRSTIANLIRLLELPDPVKDMIRTGTLPASHARALLPLGDAREQITMAERVWQEGLTVRATEEAVQQRIRKLDAEPFGLIGSDGERRRVPRTCTAHVASLENELRVALGTKVDVKQTARGRGRITIHFNNQIEFERLRKQITGQQASNRASGQ
ncbi:MAG: ParB/RepB/Spo0J family partition protein [Pirellulales bacterium]|nr:ParB/RepB/Spo0J family partition protein [Pirellulales bacterium]